MEKPHFFLYLLDLILKTNKPAAESLQILGYCHLKETSQDTTALPWNRLQRTYTQEWGQDAGLALMLAGKHKNMEMLANGKTTEENQSPLEMVPAFLE